MKTQKQVALALLAVFALSIVTSIPLMNIEAQAATTMKTYAISDAIPNQVGLGEETLLKCGITEALQSQAYGWTGITIKVVAPDGSTETLGPFTTDSTGSTYTLYTPDQIGTYTLTTNFPQQEMPVNTTVNERNGMIIYKGTIMLASNKTSTFTVTEESSKAYPGHSLPTEYWSRPIDPQLREWAVISGNWVARPDNSYVDFNQDAPETAHVLWAHPLTTGGLAGGLFSDVPAGDDTGDAYEGKFPGSVILNGILYYQRTDTRRETAPAIIAVDLHTGEEWMFRNNTVLSFGQVLYFNSYNFDGVFTYIWSVTGSTWTAYDPFTGNQQIQITNVPGSTATVTANRVYGPSGEILIYLVDLTNGWVALWNSTACGLQNAAPGQPDMGSWGNTAHGTGQPTATGPTAYGTPGLEGDNPRSFSWNVTIQKGLTTSPSFRVPVFKIYNEDRIVGIFFNQTYVRVWAVDISDLTATSTSAPKLFDKTWNPPSEWSEGSNTLHYVGASNYVTDPVYGNGVIGIFDKELTTHYGFSVVDGSYLWATESENYLDAYGWGNAEHTWYYAYGKLYSVGVGGILYAYDMASGSTVWTYNLTDAYGEPVTGENWWGWIDLITDGKVYIGTLEHSAENPMPRGAPFACVNASNGAELWRVNGMFRETRWGGNPVIGDSIIAAMDTYDQRVYAIGKGPSQTIANAPDLAVDSGDPVLITGSVMDVSPGLSQDENKLRFPGGVAAVSDAAMSDWMLYVYKQFEKPTNTTGVPVVINVVDANGNYRTVGTTTTDSNGKFAFSWQPDISGMYYLYATFAGSGGYFGSVGEDAFIVKEAPAATAAPTPAPVSAVETYFIPAVAAIVAILIVGIVLILLAVRGKRP